MAEIVLFHHIHGLTPGIEEFADRLRQESHVVHTPDLFEGRTFTTLEDGAAYCEEIGFETVVARGVEAAGALGDDLVYAGFSLGVMPAQKLAQTRTGARGALLFDACVPTGEFSDGWPENVPVQIHGMDADPIFAGEGDLDAARALVESTDQAELFLYPGDVHVFADSSLPSHDPEATALLVSRVIQFLSDISLESCR